MPADNFDGWLEEELRALLPAGGSAVPARRLSASRPRHWSRLLGWMIPPISGKILLATTALAVAGTAGAAAATGHVTLPGEHHNRAVVSPSASAHYAIVPGAPGETGPGTAHPAPPAISAGPHGPGPQAPAPRPGAEAPENHPAGSGAQLVSPAPRETPETRTSPGPAESVPPSEPPQPRESPEPVEGSPPASVPLGTAPPTPAP